LPALTNDVQICLILFALKLGAMKALLAFAAGWIAFYLADQALYDGHHVRLLARFVGSIVSGFAFR
jgi:hypothetical protein